MTFSFVLEEMKQGTRAKRNGWNGKDQYVTVGSVVSVIDCTGTFPLFHEDVGNQTLIFHGTRGSQIWVPSHSDLLANDWELIPCQN